MSIIRRHGVAFHLLPTPDDSRWLEVVRESDGAVLVSRRFDGTDDNFHRAVEAWFDEVVQESVSGIEVPVCRLCGTRRRDTPYDDNGLMSSDRLVEWEYDLCQQCASNMEQASPWIRKFLEDRYHPVPDDEDGW